MNAAKRLEKMLALAVMATAMVACASKMEPAKQALDGIESTVALASVDAGKYVPDQLANVQGKLHDLKAEFEMKNYAAVLAGAPAVVTEANGLEAAAVAKKEMATQALNEEWNSLEKSVPQRVADVNARASAISKRYRRGKGIDLAAVRSDLTDATSLWEKAQAAFRGGNLEEAVTDAKAVKGKAEAAAAALNSPASLARG